VEGDVGWFTDKENFILGTPDLANVRVLFEGTLAKLKPNPFGSRARV
jgi:hypothetical protein